LGGVALGLAGAWYLGAEKRRLLILTLLAYFPFVAYAIGYSTADSYVYLIPTYLVFALWIGYGVYALWRAARAWAGREWREGDHERLGIHKGAAAIWAGLAAVCLLLAGVPLATHWREMDLSRDDEAKEYALSALAALPPEALVFTYRDDETFALWYAHYGLGMRPDLTIITMGLWPYDWYRQDMAGRGLSLDGAGRPADIPGLIEATRGRRPVCTVDKDVGPLESYGWEPAGPVWCLQDAPDL